MGRVLRTNVGNYVYHVLNRANARAQIFDNEKDYKLFVDILEEAKEKFDMRILVYCLMPNHWHLVLYPKDDGDLSKFMNWLTLTHTQRWHVIKKTTGQGHLYQGRYKSFLCQNDAHFLTLARYVERNASKARLSRKAEGCKWGSAFIAKCGTTKQKKILSLWPVQKPKGYFVWLNKPQTKEEEEIIERSIKRGSPFGEDSWAKRIVKKFNLESTVGLRGIPQKGC